MHADISIVWRLGIPLPLLSHLHPQMVAIFFSNKHLGIQPRDIERGG